MNTPVLVISGSTQGWIGLRFCQLGVRRWSVGELGGAGCNLAATPRFYQALDSEASGNIIYTEIHTHVTNRTKKGEWKQPRTRDKLASTRANVTGTIQILQSTSLPKPCGNTLFLSINTCLITLGVHIEVVWYLFSMNTKSKNRKSRLGKKQPSVLSNRTPWWIQVEYSRGRRVDTVLRSVTRALYSVMPDAPI